jgi:hypothetical protein
MMLVVLGLGVQSGALAGSMSGIETKQDTDRTAECDRLIEVANQTVAQVQTITEQSEPGNEPLLDIAEVTEQASVTMGELTLTDTQLQDYQTQFIDMYTATSQASRELVAAVEQDDTLAAQDAYSALLRATSQEGALVNSVNVYCGADEQ